MKDIFVKIGILVLTLAGLVWITKFAFAGESPPHRPAQFAEMPYYESDGNGVFVFNRIYTTPCGDSRIFKFPLMVGSISDYDLTQHIMDYRAGYGAWLLNKAQNPDGTPVDYKVTIYWSDTECIGDYPRLQTIRVE